MRARPALARSRRRRFPDPATIRTRQCGLRVQQGFTAGILDAIDVIRGHFVAAVGKRGIGICHLQRAQRGRAQRHGEVVGKLRLVESESLHVVPGVVAADFAHQPDRHQVARMSHRLAQPNGTEELAFVFFGSPGLLHARLVDHDGCVHDDARRRKALVERRRVDEGLESRSRLASRLGHAIELALEEVEAAHQGDHRAVLGIHRYQGALRLGNLDELK